ncbi:MAG: ABC transporter substrate binding protein [Halarcobacter sp.]
MKFLIVFIICTLSLFAFEKNEILLLHSYNKGLKWSDGISKGVNEVFEKHPEYELTTEYMDSKKIDTDEYLETLLRLYELKFSKREYKAVIVADNYAYIFALKYHKKLFKNVPIIFCGLENFEENIIPKNLRNKITGVIEYKDVKKNLKLISRVIKNLNTVYIISDDTLSSNKIKPQILEDAKAFEKKFNVIYDNKIEFGKLNNTVKKLPKNSAVLFTSFYVDKNGEYIPYNKIREFFKTSKYPVFALNTIHLGEGVVGGIMIDPQQQGILAAKKVFEIFSGKKISNIPVEKPTGKYYFDYKVLKKFDLLNSNISTLSTIINKPKNFFDNNRELVNSVFVMVPILILLLLGLIVAIVRNTKAEIKLFEQNKLDNVLLNNIKNAIFWESNDGVVLGCNNAFCKFVKLHKDDILGNKVFNLMPVGIQRLKILHKTFEEEEILIKDEKNQERYLFIRRKQYFDKKERKAGVVTVISDHTNIKQLEKRRQNDEKFVVQRAKTAEIGEMITSIAHQWKKPLIEISTIVQELLYKRSKKDISVKETKEYVDEIMTQVQYMTQTIDNFRSFIKPSIKKSNFCIKKSFDSILEVMEHSIKYNYVDLKVSYEGDNLRICAYENEFKQCIISIINNSIDSIKKQKKQKDIEGKIVIDVYEESEKIFISVKDNGIGIKQDNLKKVFDPFFSTKPNGDGFGLYMTKLIIEEKMSGSIEALECNDGANILIKFENKSCKDENTST